MAKGTLRFATRGLVIVTPGLFFVTPAKAGVQTALSTEGPGFPLLRE